MGTDYFSGTHHFQELMGVVRVGSVVNDHEVVVLVHVLRELDELCLVHVGDSLPENGQLLPVQARVQDIAGVLLDSG